MFAIMSAIVPLVCVPRLLKHLIFCRVNVEVMRKMEEIKAQKEVIS